MFKINYVIALFVLFVMCNANCFSQSNSKMKQDMIDNLHFIKRTMQVQYAPFKWKQEFLGWDVEQEFDKAVNQILNYEITIKNYQKIIKEFLGSVQDYHVQATFFSTESAFLPFSVKTINHRTFIDWIDGNYWPQNMPQLQQGDEILHFGGISIDQALEQVKATNGKKGNDFTDQALADHSLTLRLGSAGHDVPKGPITIVIKTKEGEVLNLNFDWIYKPEKIASLFNVDLLLDSIKNPSHFVLAEEKLKSLLHKKCMITPLNANQVKNKELRHGEVGAPQSFLPLLGEPLWMFESKSILNLETRDNNGEIKPSKRIKWFAYIYANENGKNIGYLRLPNYSGEDEDFSSCIPIIAYLERHTDGLVLDQLNNPGGYVFFMNQILSLLTPYSLNVPKHQVAINQKEVMEAVQQIDELNDYVLFNVGELKQKSFRQMINYYQFILEEWNQGRTLTDPVHLSGVEAIQPYRIHYTKPILMLINELDFSAADFAPIILKDNQRVTLMGKRTAGAGGAVSSFSFPNQYGIKEISFTDTLALRDNLQKVENLGVAPDEEYEITEQDLLNGYQDYKLAINIVIDQLLNSNLY